MSKPALTVSAIATCSSKVAYASEGDSQNALRQIKKGRRFKQKTGRVGKISVYRCSVCHLWHHGHDNKSYAKKREPKELA